MWDVVSLSRAVKGRKVRLRGPWDLRRAFPEWLGLGLFTEVERPFGST